MVKRMMVWIIAVMFFTGVAPVFAADGSIGGPNPSKEAYEHANKNARFKRAEDFKKNKEALKATKKAEKEKEDAARKAENEAEKASRASEKEAKKKQKELEKESGKINKGFGK